MKKGNIIKIICLVIVLILIICVVLFSKNIFTKSDIEGPNKANAVYNIKYSIPKDEYCSCITFYSDGKFSEYDCESEPTEMPFSGEYYNKYVYGNDKIIFKGKGVKDITAEVLNWDKNKLTLKVLGSKQNKACSSNGKDTYDYYVYELSANGKKILEILNEINKDNLIIEYWGDNGYSCNTKEIEKCSEASFISNKEIKEELNNDEEFTLTYYRDKNGNIESVYINKE